MAMLRTASGVSATNSFSPAIQMHLPRCAAYVSAACASNYTQLRANRSSCACAFCNSAGLVTSSITMGVCLTVMRAPPRVFVEILHWLVDE